MSAALGNGAELNRQPLSVPGLDAGGHQLAFQRQDGAGTLRAAIATGKAAGALALGISSRRIGEMAAERPSFIASLGPISPHGIVRSEERRVGKACVSTCRSRWSPSH